MAKLAGRTAIYDMAAQFRERCLLSGRSLLWPADDIWSEGNLLSLWQAVSDAPDLSDRSFYQKLETQLSGVAPAAHRVAVDILSFYYLFTDAISPDRKRSQLRAVLRWRTSEDDQALIALEPAIEERGIGNPGVYYNTGLPWHFCFLVALGLHFRRIAVPSGDPAAIVAAADAAAAKVQANTRVMRNVSLHLLLPEQFERISSDEHKALILSAYATDDPKSGTVDDRLLAVRTALEKRSNGQPVDFYQPAYFQEWKKAEPTEEAIAGAGIAERRPKVWVEKTHTEGVAGRLEGPNALGRALWSPQLSNAGVDIYWAMREVRPGDKVLHLTDNRGFTGVSEVAAEAVGTFHAPEDTEWAGKPAYRVELRSFTRLDPPLLRDTFFSEPFASELVKLLDAGLKHVFYSKEPSLNQGRYLSEAPPAVVEILNRAYRSICERDLVELYVVEADIERSPAPTPQGRRTGSTGTEQMQEVCDAFAEALRQSGLTFGKRHDAFSRSFVVSLATKRFVILTGLSGSGKTQIALKFGQWLCPNRTLVVAVRPDWTGAEALLGFEDALQPSVSGRKAWQVPQTLEFFIRATASPQLPFLLVLDEMNLAHVERYFADVLSGMESGEGCIPNLVQEPDGCWRLRENSPAKLKIPKNLFIVGTVNVDETTYMFSPKVLDRANTFEFRVLSEDLVPTSRGLSDCAPAPAELAETLLAVAADRDSHQRPNGPDTSEFSMRFKEVHVLLARHGFEFGHRTYFEAMRFASLAQDAGDRSRFSALDWQVLQKVLPRLHGSRKRLEPLLRSLAAFCVDTSNTDTRQHMPDFEFPEPTASQVSSAHLPNSLDKVVRMLRTLRANQFVSFTE